MTALLISTGGSQTAGKRWRHNLYRNRRFHPSTLLPLVKNDWMQWEVSPTGMDTFHTWLIWWQNKGGGPPLSPPAPCPKPCLKSKFSYTHVSPCTTGDMFQGCENSNSVLHLPFSQPLASEERSGSMRVLQSESENSFQHYTSRHPEICQWPRRHKLVTSRILAIQYFTLWCFLIFKSV